MDIVLCVKAIEELFDNTDKYSLNIFIDHFRLLLSSKMIVPIDNKLNELNKPTLTIEEKVQKELYTLVKDHYDKMLSIYDAFQQQQIANC